MTEQAAVERDPGRQRVVVVASVAMCLAIVGHYFRFVWLNALNIPFADDILDVLRVLLEFLRAADPAAALATLFEQHNDHRTLSSRLLYLLLYRTRGEIDFRTLTMVANLALPVLALLLLRMVQRREARWPAMVVVALLLFQLRAYGIVLWPMAAFAYFFVHAYAFASLAFLHAVTPGRLFLAMLAAALATFTMASGQLCWLLGGVSLAHQAFVLRRNAPGYLLVWLAAAAAALWLWRLGLETPNTMRGVLAHLAGSPGHHAAYFLTLLGNVFSESSVHIAAAGGGLMLLAVIGSSWSHYREADIRVELCCWLLILSAAAMMLGRAPYSELEYALSSRYSFPSTLLLASVWIMLVNRLPVVRWRWFAGAGAVAAVFWASSWWLYAAALQPHTDKRIERFDRGEYWVWGHPMKETNAIVAEAIARGLYRPPQRPHPAVPQAPAR